jgi:hypothetical protein
MDKPHFPGITYDFSSNDNSEAKLSVPPLVYLFTRMCTYLELLIAICQTLHFHVR